MNKDWKDPECKECQEDAKVDGYNPRIHVCVPEVLKLLYADKRFYLLLKQAIKEIEDERGS